jgi:hypothetical protein
MEMQAMKIRCLALLSAVALTAHAATTQWKPSTDSMFDFVQNGYAIASVAENRSTASAVARTFYLQKDNNVAYCTESLSDAVPPRCYTLVRPFESAQ